ncbi:hypothetical protein [Candidatus Poriferisodalis sp.]|uniref:hypothetical protein n=1 Tax=Candidatus Poriferisodalis sp. TaxID=3101277 RepID=UPI003C6F2349
MSFDDHQLLSRLADTLRSQIAPAVDDEFARTQAFMASVILQRLAKQARFEDEHHTAEIADVAALADQLDAVFATGGSATDVPAAVTDAVARMRVQASISAASEVIDALYRWDPSHPLAAAALAATRHALRRDIDRRMDIAQ